MRLVAKVIAALVVLVVVNALFFGAAWHARTGSGEAEAAVTEVSAPAGGTDVRTAANSAEVSPEPRSALEVLDRYVATQEKLKSCVMKIRTTRTADFQFSGDYENYAAGQNGRWECGYSSEFASDGERYVLHSEGRGYVDGAYTMLPDKKACQSFLWDGQDGYAYSKSRLKHMGRPDGLFLSQGEADRPFGSVIGMPRAGSVLSGYLWMDHVRADVLARRAESLRLRPEMEVMGGSLCHVIEADSKWGHYTLWLDARHGYQLVGADVVRCAGDITQASGLAVPDGIEFRASFRVTRLEQVDGTWVPMAGDAEHRYIFPRSPADRGLVTSHVERSEVTPNPDHEKRRSFYPDFITEGTVVTILTGRKTGRAGTHVWRNGRPELAPN